MTRPTETLTVIIKDACRNWLIENGLAQKTFTDNASYLEAAVNAVESGKLTPEKFAELNGSPSKSPSPSDVFGGDNIRLRKPSERYSSTKSVAKHARSGKTVVDQKGKIVETTSELENFQIGCWLKHRAARDGQTVVMSDHEREAVEQIYAESTFCGKLGSQYETSVPGARVKSLLNDATSGGAELVPEWFDDAIIQFPLLHSELLPRVDLRDVPRGSNVEGASVSNPTVTWGTNDGTAISPFDTASLVDAIDTSIHPVTCAVEIGRDFLSDAAVDVGRILVENIGQRMLSELDRVIVIGNGTTQPTGIFTNLTGMNDIGNPAGGAGADPQVNDYEELLFSVGKQYRNASMRPAFIANDVTYSRARGIPVGASDARRVFGMSEQDYMLLGLPFVIQNDLGNAVAGLACLSRYRLYRRAGQEIRFTSEGRELALKNQTLLVVRGRFGGKCIDPQSVSYCDNMKA